MDNRSKLIMIGTLSLSLFCQGKLVAAQGEIYNPNDPAQQVVPIEAQPHPAAAKAVPEVGVPNTETEPVKTEAKPTETATIRSADPLREIKPKTKKLFLDEAFFNNLEKQRSILAKSHPGGGGDGGASVYDVQLVMTLKILTGIAIYGRRG